MNGKVHLLFRNISERLSPAWESLVALRLLAFAPFEFDVGIGIQIELLSALIFGRVALAPPAAPAGSVAPAAAAVGTLLFVAVLLLLLFSLTTVGGRRFNGTIF